ncbi:hypothetical protein B0H13DRAFT_1885255 [Mycena leptocephala]|nr:hypothetical protein B0H13DRAFT_1885255 [Mycena leptocephala]
MNYHKSPQYAPSPASSPHAPSSDPSNQQYPTDYHAVPSQSIQYDGNSLHTPMQQYLAQYRGAPPSQPVQYAPSHGNPLQHYIYTAALWEFYPSSRTTIAPPNGVYGTPQAYFSPGPGTLQLTSVQWPQQASDLEMSMADEEQSWSGESLYNTQPSRRGSTTPTQHDHIQMSHSMEDGEGYRRKVPSRTSAHNGDNQTGGVLYVAQPTPGSSTTERHPRIDFQHKIRVVGTQDTEAYRGKAERAKKAQELQAKKQQPDFPGTPLVLTPCYVPQTTRPQRQLDTVNRNASGNLPHLRQVKQENDSVDDCRNGNSSETESESKDNGVSRKGKGARLQEILDSDKGALKGLLKELMKEMNVGGVTKSKWRRKVCRATDMDQAKKIQQDKLTKEEDLNCKGYKTCMWNDILLRGLVGDLWRKRAEDPNHWNIPDVSTDYLLLLFLNSVKEGRYTWIRQQPCLGESKAQYDKAVKQAKSSRSRKDTKWKKRSRMAQKMKILCTGDPTAVKIWVWVKKLLALLGTLGMSSEDVKPHKMRIAGQMVRQMTHVIRICPWHLETITDTLELVDIAADQISLKKGLPETLYDEQWMADGLEMDPEFMDDLNVSEEAFEIMELVFENLGIEVVEEEEAEVAEEAEEEDEDEEIWPKKKMQTCTEYTAASVVDIGQQAPKKHGEFGQKKLHIMSNLRLLWRVGHRRRLLGDKHPRNTAVLAENFNFQVYNRSEIVHLQPNSRGMFKYCKCKYVQGQHSLTPEHAKWVREQIQAERDKQGIGKGVKGKGIKQKPLDMNDLVRHTMNVSLAESDANPIISDHSSGSNNIFLAVTDSFEAVLAQARASRPRPKQPSRMEQSDGLLQSILQDIEKAIVALDLSCITSLPLDSKWEAVDKAAEELETSANALQVFSEEMEEKSFVVQQLHILENLVGRLRQELPPHKRPYYYNCEYVFQDPMVNIDVVAQLVVLLSLVCNLIMHMSKSSVEFILRVMTMMIKYTMLIPPSMLQKPPEIKSYTAIWAPIQLVLGDSGSPASGLLGHPYGYRFSLCLVILGALHQGF